jgi:hypothetical protein
MPDFELRAKENKARSSSGIRYDRVPFRSELKGVWFAHRHPNKVYVKNLYQSNTRNVLLLNRAHVFHATRIYPSSSGYFASVVATSALPMTSQNVVGIGTPMSVHVLEIIPSDTFVQSNVIPPSAQTKQLLHFSASAPSPALAVQTRPDPSSASPPSLNPIISFESTSRHKAKGVVTPRSSG